MGGQKIMAKGKLRTIVYIDGFNFYYGAVRGTPWKWLNLETFFPKLLGSQNQLTAIKYYTAKVQPTPHDPAVNARQDAYFQALAALCPLVKVYFGHFLRHEVPMENANPPPARVNVFKTEEKGSDVNLALHLLNDAWRDNYDCAVVVSNDSDLAEALRLVKAQHGKVIGIVTPGFPVRKTSYQLRKHSDFLKRISTWMLETSQLPNQIPGTNIRKPSSW